MRITSGLRRITAIFGAAVGLAASGRAQAAPIQPPTWTLRSGVKITASGRFRPGAYRLTDSGQGVAQVSGHDFTLDFAGARISGPGRSEGVGLHIMDARRVTIRNADVSGFLWGVVVERSRGVVLQNCRASYNAHWPPGTEIDESGRAPEDNHGGGILIRDCQDCRLTGCATQQEWDGIDVVNSDGNLIENGDASYNGNWGLHLWNSSRNTFRGNRAVWCTTGAGLLYQSLNGWQTYDAQAVGIDHNSSENVIENNDLRFGGDGIFIRANEGPIAPETVVPPRNGSHRNVLRNNDCSFSPNNAIEVDLVDDTVIEGNNCSYSHYGMWLGYSRRCLVRGNVCLGDTAHAIEIENGQDDRLDNNIFGWQEPALTTQTSQTALVLRQNGRDRTPSGPYQVVNNVFLGVTTGARLRDTPATFVNNTLFPAGQEPGVLAATEGTGNARQFNSVVRQGLSTMPPQPDGPEVRSVSALRPDGLTTLKGTHLRVGAFTPVVTINGIPVPVRQAFDSFITFVMPPDFWNRPVEPRIRLRVFNGRGWTDIQTQSMQWPANQSRLDTITPDDYAAPKTLAVTGANLRGGRLLLEGKPLVMVSEQAERLVARLPASWNAQSHGNLVWTRGNGPDSLQTWPIALPNWVPAAKK